MDYYEELGVGRSASADEIRHRYKQLVRLLHPDHCPDEQVRPLAELQMKRLNGIVSVLTSEEDRALYDRSLRVPVPGTRRAPWFWISTAVATLVLLIFYGLFRPPEPPTQTVALPVEQQELPSIVLQRKPPVPTLRPVTSSSIPLTLRPPVPNSVDGEVPPDPPVVPLELAVPRLENVTLPAATVAQAHLPGVWLLASSNRSRNDGLYPAEYIELRMVESSGTLHGSYRARYRVVDRTISPVVAFQFEGPSDGDTVSLSWKGADGSRGDVELRLLTPSSLDVNWVASQLGSQMGLVSGTATLTRRAD